jgi:2,3-bisphosphoglycerate-independent phosphoglycerate mutase
MLSLHTTEGAATRGHSLELQKIDSKTKLRMNYFTFQGQISILDRSTGHTAYEESNIMMMMMVIVMMMFFKEVDMWKSQHVRLIFIIIITYREQV